MSCLRFRIVGRGFVVCRVNGDVIKRAIFKNCADFSGFAGVGWGNERGGGWCNGCGEVLVSVCCGGVVARSFRFCDSAIVVGLKVGFAGVVLFFCAESGGGWSGGYVFRFVGW